MINLKKYNRMKKLAETLRSDADKAAGSLETLMERLKKDHGVSTLAEAKEKLRSVRKQGEKLEREFLRLYAAFEKQWGEKLAEEDK